MPLGDCPLDLLRSEPGFQQGSNELGPEDVAEPEGSRLTRLEDSDPHQPFDAVRGDACLHAELLRGEGPAHARILGVRLYGLRDAPSYGTLSSANSGRERQAAW